MMFGSRARAQLCSGILHTSPPCPSPMTYGSGKGRQSLDSHKIGPKGLVVALQDPDAKSSRHRWEEACPFQSPPLLLEEICPHQSSSFHGSSPRPPYLEARTEDETRRPSLFYLGKSRNQSRRSSATSPREGPPSTRSTRPCPGLQRGSIWSWAYHSSPRTSQRCHQTNEDSTQGAGPRPYPRRSGVNLTIF